MSNVSQNEKSKIINLYALFGIVILLTLLPHPAAAVASLFMAVLLILTTYKMRGPKDNPKQSYIQNHAAFILKTIIGVTLIMLVTMSLASFYLLGAINYEPFEPCAQNLQAMDPQAMQNASNEEVLAIAEPCMVDFLAANQNALATGMMIGAVLPLFYIGWRFSHGFTRALKAIRIDNPQKWL